MNTHTGKWYGIMFHHTAGATADKMKQIQTAHINNNKWGNIGYHYVLEIVPEKKTSKIVTGRDSKYQGAHAGIGKYNNGYIGVCLPGNYEINKMPDWLYNQVIGHIAKIMKKYNAYGFLGHREVKATACPGKYIDLNKMRKDLSKSLGKTIKAIKL